MPSTATITTFHSFTQDTRARASQVNTNFSVFRGTIVPVEVLTATSSDNAYDLGSDEHRWRNVYTNGLDLETSTSTASLTISGDSSDTNGAFLFKVEGTTIQSIAKNISYLDAMTTTGGWFWRVGGTTVGLINSNGFDGQYLKAVSVDTAQIAASAVTPAKRSTALQAKSVTINSTTAITTSASGAVTITGTGRPIVVSVTMSEITTPGTSSITFSAGAGLVIYRANSPWATMTTSNAAGTFPFTTFISIDQTGNVGSITFDLRTTSGTAGPTLGIFTVSIFEL